MIRDSDNDHEFGVIDNVVGIARTRDELLTGWKRLAEKFRTFVLIFDV